jgi:hypothetical protein
MSGDDSLDAVHAYIARIDSERQAQGTVLSQEDFEAIAEELGLDAEARAELESRAEEHMLRGQGFFSQQLLENAVQAFEIARELQPWSLDPIKALARCHAKAWDLEGESTSQAAAKRYCKQWIERSPSDPEPYALMKALKDRADLKKWVRLTSFFVGVGILAAFGGYCTVKGLEVVGEEVDESKKQAAIISVSPDVEVGLEIPMGRSDLEGLELDLRNVERHHYDWSEPQKIAVTIQGYLHNGTLHEIRQLDVEVQYLDEDEDVLWTEILHVQSSVEPGCRPGDSMDFSSYLTQELPDTELDEVESVLFVPYKVDLGAGAASYDPSPVRELGWLNEPGSHIALELRERQYSPGTPYHRGIYEIENTGQQDLETVKLEFAWTDSEGEEIGNFETYAVSSGVRLAPGDVVLVRVIESVLEISARPTVRVIDYK